MTTKNEIEEVYNLNPAEYKDDDERSKQQDEKEMSIIEHLKELRSRLLISVAAVVIVSLLVFPYVPNLVLYVKNTLLKNVNLFLLSPQAGIILQFKVSIFLGIILCLPVIVYEVWAFVSPAVHRKSRKVVPFLLITSGILSILGAVFAFKFFIPVVLRILIQISTSMAATPMYSLEQTFSFILLFTASFSIIFQLPLLIGILGRVGIVNYRMLASTRRGAILVILIISAFITPDASPLTMFFMALPIVILYEISIWVVKLVGPKDRGY